MVITTGDRNRDVLSEFLDPQVRVWNIDHESVKHRSMTVPSVDRLELRIGKEKVEIVASCPIVGITWCDFRSQVQEKLASKEETDKVCELVKLGYDEQTKTNYVYFVFSSVTSDGNDDE